MSSYKQLSNQGPPLLSTGASKSRDKRRPISGVISTGHGPRCSTPLIHGQQWAKQQVLARFIVFSANLNFVTMFSLPASYVEMEDPSRFIGGEHSHSSNHDPPDWEDVWGAGSDKCAVASSTIRRSSTWKCPSLSRLWPFKDEETQWTWPLTRFAGGGGGGWGV